MSTKLEDGIWYGTWSDGDHMAAFIRGDKCAGVLEWIDNPLRARKVGDQFKPLRRIATLDGKPVVDEGVIEKLAQDLYSVVMSMGAPLSLSIIRDILRKHLDPAKQELPPIERIEAVAAVIEDRDRLQARVAELEAKPTLAKYRETATGDEQAVALLREVDEYLSPNRANSICTGSVMHNKIRAHLSRLALTLSPPTTDAEGPIVRFEGAFPCWRTKHTDGPYTAWPNDGGFAYVRNDGKTLGWYSVNQFEDNFIREKPRPIQLSPEQEKLVQPIADWAKRTPEEAREFLAKQGA